MELRVGIGPEEKIKINVHGYMKKAGGEFFTSRFLF